MSDIFHEVDEEVRREQFQKLWERYGIFVIAACVLLVAAVGGWRAYEWWETKRSAEAGVAFEAAITLVEQGKREEAAAAFAKLAAEAPTSYRTLARFREAAEIARSDLKAAVALYDALAADAGHGPILQQLAALRAGMVLVDSAPFDEMRRRIEPLTAPDHAFRHSARGLLALAAWRANDLSATRRWSDMVLADAETPPGTRGQIEMLMALAGADRKS